MEVPKDEYSIDSFINIISKLGTEVLSEEDARNELKVFFYYTNNTKIISFYQGYKTQWMGDILHISVPYEKTDDDQEDEFTDDYYSFLYRNEIMVMVTSATLERHHPNLGRHLVRSRGITEMWINPSTMKSILQDLDDRHPAMRIDNFIAKRNPHDQTSSKIRPNIRRRVNYTGIDGKDVLKELEYNYGVHATKLDCCISSVVSLKIYEEGIFILRGINKDTFNEVFHLFSIIEDEILSLYSTARGLRFKTRPIKSSLGTIYSPEITTGEVLLTSGPLTGPIAEEFVKGSPEFSFLDIVIEEGSLNLSAIIVDEVKNSVFDLSGTEDSLIIIPKYDTTFDSFVRFYRFVSETIDSKAMFAPMVS